MKYEDSVHVLFREKTVHYMKRGLKVVGPKSIFDLDKPPWVPDEKVQRSQS